MGLVLLFSGSKFLFSRSAKSDSASIKEAPVFSSLVWGGAIGFLSGITGTGGAIFFTPLILKMNWADPKKAAGLSVVFVLANSIFALAGIFKSSQFFDFKLSALWAASVILGAIVGTHFGVFKFSNNKIQKVLGVVMVIAAVKLLMLGLNS